tara:strand:+ start:255 stop:557 length:303 start_codon:yes stop_codon:yes gene_type:complete
MGSGATTTPEARGGGERSSGRGGRDGGSIGRKLETKKLISIRRSLLSSVDSSGSNVTRGEGKSGKRDEDKYKYMHKAGANGAQHKKGGAVSESRRMRFSI